MNKQLKTILDDLGDTELASIAAGALGAKRAWLVGSPEFVELSAPHFDRKTIGIVRTSGRAGLDDGAITRRWSAVAKISDLSLAPNEGNVTYVEDEATVYEQRLVANDGLRFRPARCYAISRPTPSIRVLWLEDLTDARGTPFDVATLRTIMRHLGEWNGHHAVQQTSLSIPTRRDAFAARFHATSFGERVEEFPDFANAPGWRPAFGDLPTTIVPELYDLLGRLIARTATLPHALAFGDLAAGNVFLKGNETIAVDWASLTVDPVGVDGGCLTGSPLTWAGGATIAAAETELFDAYFEGLKVAGWKGNRDDVRRAFLCLYGLYQLTCGLMPVYCAKLHPYSREFMEARFKTSLETLPQMLSGVFQQFPATIDEMGRLVG